jgi:hypothetical protein
MSDAELHADITADAGNLFSVIEQAMSALTGLQGSMAGIGGGAFLTAAVTEAASFQDATVQLDTALKSAKANMQDATRRWCGHWATVTQQRQASIGKTSTKSLAAQDKITLHNAISVASKHASRLALNRTNTWATCRGTSANIMLHALGNATTTQKVWVNAMQDSGFCGVNG